MFRSAAVQMAIGTRRLAPGPAGALHPPPARQNEEKIASAERRGYLKAPACRPLGEKGRRRHDRRRERVLQSLIERSKAGSEERSLFESLSNHIGAKGAKKKEQQPTLPEMADDL